MEINFDKYNKHAFHLDYVLECRMKVKNVFFNLTPFLTAKFVKNWNSIRGQNQGQGHNQRELRRKVFRSFWKNVGRLTKGRIAYAGALELCLFSVITLST